jgi:hypothetical protein
VKGCGYDRFSEILRKDATYAKLEQLQNLQLSKMARARSIPLNQKKITSINDGTIKLLSTPPSPTVLPDIVIPIVFHIVNNNPNAITDLMILNALVDLNDAFAHRNAYSSDT